MVRITSTSIIRVAQDKQPSTAASFGACLMMHKSFPCPQQCLLSSKYTDTPHHHHHHGHQNHLDPQEPHVRYVHHF